MRSKMRHVDEAVMFVRAGMHSYARYFGIEVDDIDVMKSEDINGTTHTTGIQESDPRLPEELHNSPLYGMMPIISSENTGAGGLRYMHHSKINLGLFHLVVTNGGATMELRRPGLPVLTLWLVPQVDIMRWHEKLLRVARVVAAFCRKHNFVFVHSHPVDVAKWTNPPGKLGIVGIELDRPLCISVDIRVPRNGRLVPCPEMTAAIGHILQRECEHLRIPIRADSIISLRYGFANMNVKTGVGKGDAIKLIAESVSNRVHIIHTGDGENDHPVSQIGGRVLTAAVGGSPFAAMGGATYVTPSDCAGGAAVESLKWARDLHL